MHENFRLIVVAEDSEVYEKFPIPLINRLEKHFLGMETMLDHDQKKIVAELKDWVREFCRINVRNRMHEKISQFEPGDVIIGYHGDVIASMVLQCQGEP